ncbi:serine/threonine-protein kinase [Sorangium sp. So ce134]
MSASQSRTRTSTIETAVGACALGPGDVLLARYNIEFLIGSGAFGWVFAAIDVVHSPPRRVAVKMLRPQPSCGPDGLRRSARRELGILLRVHAESSAPPVVKPLEFDVLEHEGLPFLVLEFIDGPSLQERMSGKRALTGRDACFIGAKIARGLAAIHDVGAIHGDLKPTNIRLRGDAGPVIVDLGAANMDWEGRPGTHAGGSLTTALYAAPELLAGGPPSPASDVYALGLIMFQLLFNVGPMVPRQTARAMLARASSARWPRRRSGSELAAWLLRCLHPEPPQRPTAAEVAAALTLGLKSGGAMALAGARRSLRTSLTVLASRGLRAASITTLLFSDHASQLNHPTTELTSPSCRTSYYSEKELPSDVQVIDFETCHGCPCCDGGYFRSASTTECDACAMRNSLAASGITVTAVEPAKGASRGTTDASFEGRYLRADYNDSPIRFNLSNPTSLFGLSARLSIPVLRVNERGTSPHGVTIHGYDIKGTRIATSTVDFTKAERTGQPSSGNHVTLDHMPRFIGIISCDGPKISKVEVEFTDVVGLDHLTLHPSRLHENSSIDPSAQARSNDDNSDPFVEKGQSDLAHSEDAEASKVDHSSSCLHQGSISIASTPPEELRSISEEFRRRNGRQWSYPVYDDRKPHEVDGIGKFITFASNPGSPEENIANQPGIEGDAAKRVALEFVRKNMDLLGLTATSMKTLSVDTWASHGRLIEPDWEVVLRGTYPRRGYESIEAVADRIHIRITVSSDGIVRMVRNYSRIFPKFDLCLEPKISPNEAIKKINEAHDPPTDSRRGSLANIKSTRLTINVKRDANGMTLTLAYEFDTHEMGRLFVDAHTGELLEERGGIPVH